MIKLKRCNSEDLDFQTLVKVLDNELTARYGTLQAHYDEYNNIESNDTVVIGYIEDIPVGCGCFRDLKEDTAEIKRMVVCPEFRGSGVAKEILLEIERWVIEKGYSNSVLETGIKQPEALRFYSKLGYNVIDNYGQYEGNPNSVCMKKELVK
jgi:putative acetyltransferase